MGQDLVERLRRHLGEEHLFPQAGIALVAVSGGADSVALLLLMQDVARDLSIDLAVAHVDHGIAHASADVARRVADLAAETGAPFSTRVLELGVRASETKARDARYSALREMQREAGARYLVTAHHRDDHIETILYRALRGSGMAGLAGIPTIGPDGLVRPLLPFSRRELVDWLGRRATHGALPYDDPANRDSKHDRSWLRHQVIPRLIKRFGDDFARHMEALAGHASDERTAWAALLRSLPELEFRAESGVVEVARAPLLRYDKTLSEALLRALGRELGTRIGDTRATRLRAFLDGGSGRHMELGQGYVAEIAFDRLRLLTPASIETPAATMLGAGDRGMARWGRWRFTWRRERAGAPERSALTTWVTLGPATIRPLGGDERVIPLGGAGHRKVRRLLMEAKIPASERDTYPLCARSGDVLWIPGVCRTALDVPREGETALRIDADTIAG